MVYVEGLFILLIIAMQIKVSFDLHLLIKQYKSIFSKRIDIILRGDAYPILSVDNPNILIQRIIDPLNQYLAANYGAAVNFTIIKDVIDREIDLNDDEISQKLPVPLYLGLAATMMGIIFGLISLGINSTEITESISVLMICVAIAMGASLLGLALTTWFTSFEYKSARTIIAKGKADLLNELQTRLLPELNRADDSEINGLKSCLNEFARQSAKMVEDLRTVGENTALTIKHQQESVTKLESLNIKKIADYNVKVFDKIEGSFDRLDQFSSYMDELNKISSNLVRFTNSVGNIEEMVKSIQENSCLSKDISLYLTDHLKKLDSINTTVEKTLSTQGYSTIEIVEKFKEKIHEVLESLNNQAVSFDRDVTKSTQALYDQMERVALEHGQRLTEVFAQTAPDLSPLHEIKDDMKESIKALVDLQKLDVIAELIQSNRELNEGVKDDLLKKLSDILEILSSINSPNNKVIHQTRNNGSYANPVSGTYGETQNQKPILNNAGMTQKPIIPMVKELYVQFPNSKGEFIDNIAESRGSHNLMIKPDSSGVTGALVLCTNVEDYTCFFEDLKNLEPFCDISAINKKDSAINMITEGRVRKQGSVWVVERKMKIASNGKKGLFKKLFGK